MPRSLALSGSYNVCVPTAPFPVPPRRRARPRIFAREATGLIIVAILLMVLTLVRYWRYIPWNWR
jgi:hypothetical protein